MTFFQRAASVAAFSLFVAGMGSASAGFASEMDRTSIHTPVIVAPALVNGLSVDPVPSTPDVAPVPAADGVTVQALPDADDDYDSLQDAVDAQDVPVAVDADLACLAGAIYFESKGEPLSGQLAVAEVIMNRAKSGRFPTSICSVVTQPGQFSFVRGGQIPSIDLDRPAYRTAIAVAQVALKDAWDSPAPEALFFHARRVAPGWNKRQIASIGNHVFFR